MPQLDLLTYFNQIFWLLLFFTVFYLFVLKYLLPLIYKIIKIRYQKSECIKQNSENFCSEKKQVFTLYDNRFEKVFLQAIALLQKQKRMQLVWVEKKMSKEFNSINISYLNSLTLVKLRSFFFIKI